MSGRSSVGRRARRLAAAAGVLLASAVPAAAAGTVRIDEWPIPLPVGSPRELALGPDQMVWATSTASDYVYRFDPRDGALLSAFHVPDARHALRGIAAGPDGRMWVTAPRPAPLDNGSAKNALVAITPAGRQTEYPLGKKTGPTDIVAGPDGQMWFTQSGSDALGSIDPRTGTFTRYPTGTGFPGPDEVVAVGPDGAGRAGQAVWFASFGGGAATIGRFVRGGSGGFVRDTLRRTLPGGRVADMVEWHGAMWFTDSVGARLGRISASGDLQTWPIVPDDPRVHESGSKEPRGLTVGPDDRLWIAVRTINSIVQVANEPGGGVAPDFRPYRSPTRILHPLDVLGTPARNGAEASIWYASVDASRMGRIVPDGPAPSWRTGAQGPFVLSQPFVYASPTPDRSQGGFPLGLAPEDAPTGPSLEVAMPGADMVQRVPVDLRPDTADTANTPSPAPSNPYRAVRPSDGGMPRHVVADVAPDDATWATMGNDTIAKIVPGPKRDVGLTSFTLTGATACCFTHGDTIYLSGPAGIAVSPGDEPWAALFTSGKLAHVSSSVTVSERAVPSADAGPLDVTTTGKGATGTTVWFTELRAGRIGRRAPDGRLTEIPVPALDGSGADPRAEPFAIAAGPDGSIWFTVRGLTDHRVGRLSPDGAICQWRMPSADSDPSGITIGGDGAVYVAEYAAGKVARLASGPGGDAAWAEYALPYGQLSRPLWLTTDPDGSVWAGLPYRDQVARLAIPTGRTSPPSSCANPTKARSAHPRARAVPHRAVRRAARRR